MSFFVEPGEKFNVKYVSDGLLEDFPVPDVEAQTGDLLVSVNGLLLFPLDHYTVHQGQLHLTLGPIPAGYSLEIRS